MVLKEDCINFRKWHKDITGNGERQKRYMDMPDCTINEMRFGGCPENCSFYEIA